MTKRKIFERIIYAVLAVFLCVVAFLGGQIDLPAYAATNEVLFDSTAIEDDLSDVSPSDYPIVLDGKPVLFTFQEYCYTDSYFNNGNYGLYFYVYNPSRFVFSERDGANYVNMATAFDADGNAIDYNNIPLKYLSKTTGKNEGLFYKFKIADSSSLWETVKAYADAHDGERRYHIAGLQLYTSGAANAEEYNVSTTYIYTGYAAGYGTETNTLECMAQEMSSVEIDLAGVKDGVDKRVYWRADNANEHGKFHQWQINSVYFAIDNDILNQFGYKLKQVKSHWYEYQLKPVVIVEDESLYNEMKKYLGVKVEGVQKGDDSLYSSGFNENIPFDISIIEDYAEDGIPSNVYIDLPYAFNIYSTGGASFVDEHGRNHTNRIEYAENVLTSLFKTGGVDVDDFTLSAEELAQYVYDYDKSYFNGTLELSTDREISADLFTDMVDEGRTRGENFYTFNVDNPDDYYNLQDYASNHNPISTWFSEVFGGWKLSGTYEDIPPIERISADISKMKDEAVAERYFIDESFVPQFKKYYERVKDDSTIFILRYAATDYYAQDCVVRYPSDDCQLNTYLTAYPRSANAEIRQETVFLDFEILTLGFENEMGELTVIPVVCSPVDHFSAMTPSLEPEFPNWLKIFLTVLALIVLLIILMPVLPYIIQAVVWVAMLPFKAIAALVNAIKKAATKKPKTTANSPTKTVKAPQPKTVCVKSNKPKQSKEKQNK